MKNARYIFASAIFSVFLPGVIVAFIPSIVEGQVVISEVMYDLDGSDTGREWIEIFNAGQSAVMLSEWKLFEAETNHGIIVHSGNESLGSGAYAVVADNPTKFLEDHPAFTGQLFDSAFSLSNTGEVLKLHCCGTGDSLLDKDSISYSPELGAAGDGNSLHRTSVGSSSLHASASTPGSGQLQKANSNTGSVGTEEETDPQQTTSVAGDSTTSSAASLGRVSAGSDRVVIVGVEARFEGNAYDPKNHSVEAQFRWNFGDGTTALGQTVVHRWEYSGRYAVVLEAARFGETASHRVTVSVESPQLSFTVLSNGGVVIENLSNRELDISGWHISDGSTTFTFPSNTIILRNTSIQLSTGSLRVRPSPDTKLMFPNGDLALHASTPLSAQSSVSESNGIALELSEISSTSGSTLDSTSAFLTDEETLTEEDVPESANVSQEASVPEEDSIPEGNAIEHVAAAAAAEPEHKIWFLWWLGIFLVVGLGGYAVFAARRLKRRDWTIIEDASE